MLYNRYKRAWIAGVAVALSEKYATPVLLVRLIFIASFFIGIGFLVYLWLWKRVPQNNGQLGLI